MDDARRLYQRAMAGYERAVGKDHLSTLGVANNLGALELTEGNVADAQTLYERALAGREKMLGPEHINTLNTCQHLATALKRRGKRVEALAFFERSYRGYLKMYANDPTQRDLVQCRKQIEDTAREIGHMGEFLTSTNHSTI